MFVIRSFAFGALLLAAASIQVNADPPAVAGARDGLVLAEAAARSWAPDAALVYLENDEDLDATGRSPRWGYLFHSATNDRARAYSVREGKIRHAEDVEVRLSAPPLTEGWIDSDRAFDAAQEKVGLEYCEKLGGQVSAMLLVRGALHPSEPERATWTVVFRAEGAPALFVLVDAASGDVVRTWRG